MFEKNETEIKRELLVQLVREVGLKVAADCRRRVLAAMAKNMEVLP